MAVASITAGAPTSIVGIARSGVIDTIVAAAVALAIQF